MNKFICCISIFYFIQRFSESFTAIKRYGLQYFFPRTENLSFNSQMYSCIFTLPYKCITYGMLNSSSAYPASEPVSLHHLRWALFAEFCIRRKTPRNESPTNYILNTKNYASQLAFRSLIYHSLTGSFLPHGIHAFINYFMSILAAQGCVYEWVRGFNKWRRRRTSGQLSYSFQGIFDAIKCVCTRVLFVLYFPLHACTRK